MSVSLLLSSKEINGPNDKVQGPGINICYDQIVLGKENKSEGENCNKFKIIKFDIIFLYSWEIMWY